MSALQDPSALDAPFDRWDIDDDGYFGASDGAYLLSWWYDRTKPEPPRPFGVACYDPTPDLFSGGLANCDYKRYSSHLQLTFQTHESYFDIFKSPGYDTDLWLNSYGTDPYENITPGLWEAILKRYDFMNPISGVVGSKGRPRQYVDLSTKGDIKTPIGVGVDAADWSVKILRTPGIPPTIVFKGKYDVVLWAAVGPSRNGTMRDNISNACVADFTNSTVRIELNDGTESYMYEHPYTAMRALGKKRLRFAEKENEEETWIIYEVDHPENYTPQYNQQSIFMDWPDSGNNTAEGSGTVYSEDLDYEVDQTDIGNFLVAEGLDDEDSVYIKSIGVGRIGMYFEKYTLNGDEHNDDKKDIMQGITFKIKLRSIPMTEWAMPCD
jgi:hypothetical protein